MRTVDEILRDASHGALSTDAESKQTHRRYSRTRHIETVRELSKVNGYRTTAYLALQWTAMIVTFIVAARVHHPIGYVLAAIIIASRMQALGVLLHDAAHYLLYKNRTVNDVVSDLFVAFPLGLSTTLYRKTHFRHHRYTNTDEDQDLAAMQEEAEWYTWPKSRLGLWTTLLRSTFGLNFLKGWILYKHWAPWNNFRSPDFPRRCRILYLISIVSVYSCFAFALKMNTVTTVCLMAIYTLSGITILNFTNRLRTTAEHLGTDGDHELNQTRTVLPNWIERIFIAPYGVSYHLEHHLFPSVPGYQLPKLHRTLMQDDEFRTKAHITKGYMGVICELMGNRVENNSK
jgi:fatty acid desaturase